MKYTVDIQDEYDCPECRGMVAHPQIMDCQFWNDGTPRMRLFGKSICCDCGTEVPIRAIIIGEDNG